MDAFEPVAPSPNLRTIRNLALVGALVCYFIVILVTEGPPDA